tara:strand:- start:135 stop:479 length:345 start_codon:yes stop_codon:yes gene_type:complete
MNRIIQNNNFLLISIGAFPAAIIRWQIDQIFIVNLIGCFLLGFINSSNLTKRYKLILGFGFCGSLTTFSGWSFKLFKLISQGLYKLFFLNSVLLVFLAVFAIFLGHLLAKKIVN